MTEKANLMPGKKICQNCRVACQTDVKQAETKSNDDNSEFADERHFEYEHWHTRIFAIKACDWKGQGLLWKKKIGSSVYSGKRDFPQFWKLKMIHKKIMLLSLQQRQKKKQSLWP